MTTHHPKNWANGKGGDDHNLPARLSPFLGDILCGYGLGPSTGNWFSNRSSQRTQCGGVVVGVGFHNKCVSWVV